MYSRFHKAKISENTFAIVCKSYLELPYLFPRGCRNAFERLSFVKEPFEMFSKSKLSHICGDVRILDF